MCGRRVGMGVKIALKYPSLVRKKQEDGSLIAGTREFWEGHIA